MDSFLGPPRGLNWPPPRTMTLGNGQVVKVGDIIYECQNGRGVVMSFYGQDMIYCLDIKYDSGRICSHHPSMFKDQFIYPIPETLDETTEYTDWYGGLFNDG